MSENIKDSVKAFWEANPCGLRFADGEIGTKFFFESIEKHRYSLEWHIPEVVNFPKYKGKKVLEIGCGMGTDGTQFAKYGADYIGIDLTHAAIAFSLGGASISLQPNDF